MCHKPVLYRNDCMHGSSWYWHRGFHPPILHVLHSTLRFKEFRVSPISVYTFFWSFVPNKLWPWHVHHRRVRQSSVCCWQHLTTVDVASAVNIYRRPSPVGYTRRLALRTALWAIGHDAASRGSICASVETFFHVAGECKSTLHRRPATPGNTDYHSVFLPLRNGL